MKIWIFFGFGCSV